MMEQTLELSSILNRTPSYQLDVRGFRKSENVLGIKQAMQHHCPVIRKTPQITKRAIEEFPISFAIMFIKY